MHRNTGIHQKYLCKADKNNKLKILDELAVCMLSIIKQHATAFHQSILSEKSCKDFNNLNQINNFNSTNARVESG